MIINDIKFIKNYFLFRNLYVFIIFHSTKYDKFERFKNSLYLSSSFYLYYQDLKYLIYYNFTSELRIYEYMGLNKTCRATRDLNF
jgi:hypothetical protein